MKNLFQFHLLLLVVATLSACSPSRNVVVVPAAQDPQAALSQQNVNATLYQNASAEVVWMYEQAYAHARLKLDANLEDTGTLSPAVIVDVDETVLDNSPYELENMLVGRTYTPETWKAWTARAVAKPLPGALEFLKYAASRGCAIFYITNRDADETAATITNLTKYGFPMADAEHVLTMAGTSDKTERRAYVQRGHRVVLLVGDQLTDYDQALKDRSVEQGLPTVHNMAAELSRYFILLPNSTYGYWRDGITGRGTDAEKIQRVQEFIQQRVE